MLNEPMIVMEEVLETSSQEHNMTVTPHSQDRQLHVVLPSHGKTYTSHILPLLSHEDGASFMQRLRDLQHQHQSTFDREATPLLHFLAMQKYALSIATVVPVSSPPVAD